MPCALTESPVPQGSKQSERWSKIRLKVIELRSDVTLNDAKAEIITYLRKHKEAETFDIANDLRLDLQLTVKALKELWEEGRVA
jgi:DNA-binding MarR family transcriptional regulator